jgi:hypothetical protein
MKRSFDTDCTLFVLLSLLSFVAHATPVVYTEKSAWAAAVSGVFGSEDFSDAILEPGLDFVSSESGHVNPALGYYQDVLASQSQNAPMTTWSFVPPIRAFGANFTLGGPGGSGNSLVVSIVDSGTTVGTIPNSYAGGFWGFVSDTSFTAVKLAGGSGTNQQNWRMDDLVFTSVSAPAAPPLLGLALALLVTTRRRSRRHSV